MACSAEQRGLEWSSHVNLEDDRRAFPQGDVGNGAAEAAPASYEAVVLWVGISRVVAMQHVGTLPGVELKAKGRGAALGAAARWSTARSWQQPRSLVQPRRGRASGAKGTIFVGMVS